MPPGEYSVHFTYGEASARSDRFKVIRIGVTEMGWRDVHKLQFAFDTLADGKVASFEIPELAWRLADLDDAGAPVTPPACKTDGPAKAPPYSYPIAANIKGELSVDLVFGGVGYDGSEPIWVKLVRPGTEEPSSSDELFKIQRGAKMPLKLTQALPEAVGVAEIQHDFLLYTQLTNGTRVKLGRQRMQPTSVYVVPESPKRPWGPGGVPLWVEVLQKACSLWAVGAKSVADAQKQLVNAVFHDMGLTYDVNGGADVHQLIGTTGAPDWTLTFNLRKILVWLTNHEQLPVLLGPNPYTGAVPPEPPADHIWVNCSCCGALLTILTNALGAELLSSRMTTDEGTGFKLHLIVGIGSTKFGPAFSPPLANSFGYHEVGWAGTATNDDDIWDACLQLADDPANAPAEAAIPVTGIRFAVAEPADGPDADPAQNVAQAAEPDAAKKKKMKKIEDYRHRLVRHEDVSRTNARPDNARTYRPV